jgi:hypothetical protein
VPFVLCIPGTRGISPGYSFAPMGHRLNVLVRRRAPAALGIACPLSCCIGPIMDHVAVWCSYTPSTTSDCFSSLCISPSRVVQRVDCVQDTSRENDYNCITQKDTQPSQTCSEGYICLLLFATVAFLCISGSIN